MFTGTQLGGHSSGSNSPETSLALDSMWPSEHLVPSHPPYKMTPEILLLANILPLLQVSRSKQFIILSRHNCACSQNVSGMSENKPRSEYRPGQDADLVRLQPGQTNI